MVLHVGRSAHLREVGVEVAERLSKELIRLQPATSSLLASVVDSDGSFCTF